MKIAIGLLFALCACGSELPSCLVQKDGGNYLCTSYAGGLYTPEGISAACGEAGGTVTNCPSEGIVGTCTVNAGEKTEYAFTSYAGTPESAEAACLEASGVWVPKS